jgi:phosphoglycerate dehydrogenase-like enzyme
VPLLSEKNETLDNRFRITDNAAQRILFALTSHEHKQLFPNFDADTLLPSKCAWVDPCVLASPKEWNLYLQEFRPTILVSCWCTPPIPTSVLSANQPLQYICHSTGSVTGVVPREFIARGGIVTNWGNLIGHTVAEHALFLILASLRNLPSWHPALRPSVKDAWGNGPKLMTCSLRQKKVGIHGFGNVARELVSLLKPFEVTCMAYSENVPAEFMLSHVVVLCANLEELFAQNEILVECEALTPKTRGVVKERHFRLIPGDGVFVNVARGAIIDEEAMGKVAKQGGIRVASDVFVKEPLPENSPLRDIPNVMISPHIGGPTSDWYPRCGEFALQNINRYLAGKPLEGRVTLEIYDRTT